MSVPQADSSVAGFGPFLNPATGEWITYTALAEDSGGQLVRFNWRSVPGGVITEHIHPRQEERFTIVAGEAHFTLNGAELVAGAGETVVVRRVSRTPGAIPDRPRSRASSSSARPCDQGVARGPRRPGGRRQDHGPRRAAQPASARRHLLVLPPRKPGHLTADLGAEPHAPPAVGAGEGLRRTPLLRPLGQPYPRSGLRSPGISPEGD